MAPPWRRWNAALHRDLGHLALGLTLVYALSGLAVNHVADWNPNYRRVERAHDIGPIQKDLPEDSLAREALDRLGVTAKPRSVFQPDPDTLDVFVEGATYSVDLPTGKVLYQANRPRPVLHALNRLHLNAPKRAWTWIADAYAVSLALLAISGLVMSAGPKGIARRAAWLTAIGCALPLLYWIWWTRF